MRHSWTLQHSVVWVLLFQHVVTQSREASPEIKRVGLPSLRFSAYKTELMTPLSLKEHSLRYIVIITLKHQVISDIQVCPKSSQFLSLAGRHTITPNQELPNTTSSYQHHLSEQQLHEDWLIDLIASHLNNHCSSVFIIIISCNLHNHVWMASERGNLSHSSTDSDLRMDTEEHLPSITWWWVKAGWPCTCMFSPALFTALKRLKQPTCPSTYKWISIMWETHIVQP
jgi:hypothetical protein